ncbi:ADP-ribose pyrophosphatase [Actinopolymorpha singaporensis]|uniref:ADP-ribose pyrophosphatase n=1 Tax=Actinopolymorpha singaporensis TaxID=117157 RepID=A0A1H1W174_9ACTN|nr:NUDIX hydrolase [Actinopolymorpha singaporensis]SDS91028.1 ADP-ribose pyrophosphatase [Actinopolymorpha singaporensis]
MSGATVDGRFGHQEGDGAAPRDVPERWPVVSSSYALRTGRVIDIREDVVEGGGREFTRDVVVHSGAVGIIALDDHDRMLLVHQYRHPVGHRLVEPPAGLLDVEGENYLTAAQRELYEEGHVRARDWRVLVDAFTSPGMTTESLRIYLARGLSEVPHDERHNGVDEEADMTVSWTPLADVVAGVLAGDLHNPSLVMGALAAWAAHNGAGFDALRPADAPWPAREAVPYEPPRPT